ncbi:MAG: DUF1638 domain-containing protein [Kiloniellales bacterium]
MIPQPSTLFIACGALAREVVELIRLNGWTHVTVGCLPASLHNTPAEIPEAVRAKIRAARGRFDHIAVLYGDCGSGSLLDKVLDEEGVERIPGPHCYEFYAGKPDFEALMDEEPGSFFLTDYLVRHFERLIIKGLGLDRHPQLRDSYFANYRRLIYLAQTRSDKLEAQARAAAERLGLDYQVRYTGYGELGRFMEQARAPSAGTLDHGDRDHRLLA